MQCATAVTVVHSIKTLRRSYVNENLYSPRMVDTIRET